MQKCVALETLLRGIFELESASEEIIPASARIANVNLPSVYHDVYTCRSLLLTNYLNDNEMPFLNT